MNFKEAREKFCSQRGHALARGIEWRLTFQEWLDWWGDDLERRGPGREELQMQRPCDSGPYALGNIRKGTPKDNARTKGHMERKRNSQAAAVALEAERMVSPFREPRRLDEDLGLTEDDKELLRMFQPRRSLAG